ncbi:acyl carrier protein (plasmid) [Streptomyces sp. NBC_01387]|uniref:acyl carrier protein n=1 Tax=unclassified Streptomyces TaxID=2593676 RepID=UPI00202509CC|nr:MULTISPECIES: acyl carrier protein [unclassified Streptomyces]MCX4554404.1 acyl carrier protein [Streptomyces sp. NBC_01500]WSC25216.1 acyl carrier protein [Streptomyces sp. NBC_01766]WSV58908.1 acyl carrier protein [Streptomyces sp. NBC_01014]
MADREPVMPEGEILGWLAERLGTHVSLPLSEINPDVPYVEYGLDSVAALGLFGDIEEKFGLVLDPIVALEHATVRQLAAYLAVEAAEAVHS